MPRFACSFMLGSSLRCLVSVSFCFHCWFCHCQGIHSTDRPTLWLAGSVPRPALLLLTACKLFDRLKGTIHSCQIGLTSTFSLVAWLSLWRLRYPAKLAFLMPFMVDGRTSLHYVMYQEYCDVYQKYTMMYQKFTTHFYRVCVQRWTTDVQKLCTRI